MKTKTLQMTSGLLMVIFWLATFTLNAQISFEGYYADHEGGVGWDADGTGTEPARDGHGTQAYYLASPDYDNIDPNPNAALGTIISIVNGFPEFQQAIAENNVDLNDIKIRYTLSSLGNDEEGIDWLVIGNMQYNNYYGGILKIYIQNELMISMSATYINFRNVAGSGNWLVETSFLIPKNASMWSNDLTKELASAFMNDMDGQSLQLTCNAGYAGYSFNENGRDGAWYNVFNGLLTKGTPEIPFKGLNADHEGFAGWDADGTGPEPAGDGHSTIMYYVASPDYGGIDNNPEAALGHCLDGAKGFRNLMIQLEYRGYDINDVKIKLGLSSLGNDEQGIDWGSNWWNYYNMVSTIVLNDEPLLQSMSDTAIIQVYTSNYSSESTFSPTKNVSQNASEDAQIIANAFLLDLGTHQLATNTHDVRGGTNTFNGNGRNGALWEIYEAKVIGMCGMVNCVNEGEVSGTFKADNSPYLINGNIEVPAGQTLNIEKGTKIAFRGPYRIYVKGNVLAEGTAEEPITFTHSNPNVLWDGFDYDSIDSPNDTSFFNYCLFEYGSGFGEGAYNSGGIFALSFFDKLRVENSVFRYNQVNKAGTYSPSGGAVALWHASPTFVNCIFHDNQAKYGGAMMVYFDSNPVVSNCLFYNNNAEQDGGAIEVWASTGGAFINNTFTDNFAGRDGGAFDCYSSSTPTIINTILWGNRASSQGNQVNLGSFSNPNFYNCNVQGGPDEFGGTEFTGEYLGCIDEDPMFLNDGEHPYQLEEDSPCNNNGSMDISEFILPEFDLAGNPRIDETFVIIDIGAYEYNYLQLVNENVESNSNILVYPNPFYHSTSIEFTLEKASWVQIDVYNVIGEKVDVITQSELPAGKHTLNWQAPHLSKGLYFIKLQAGNTITTTKLLKN